MRLIYAMSFIVMSQAAWVPLLPCGNPAQADIDAATSRPGGGSCADKAEKAGGFNFAFVIDSTCY